MSDARFYILSVKWSRDECLTWWRPESSGYTHSLDDAGEYDAEYADAVCRSTHGDNVAVPVDVALSFTVLVVLDGKRREMLEMVEQRRLRDE